MVTVVVLLVGFLILDYFALTGRVADSRDPAFSLRLQMGTHAWHRTEPTVPSSPTITFPSARPS
ncbi:MAG TPA: hypothetical protein VHI14_00675 [Jatrophihabitantaceae bacterium]|jgi:hypothetical protein|nr:hypothetical protein [Jatrophihabitantaceae bacterium]